MNNSCPMCGRSVETSAEHIRQLVREADLRTSGNEAGEEMEEVNMKARLWLIALLAMGLFVITAFAQTNGVAVGGDAGSSNVPEITIGSVLLAALGGAIAFLKKTKKGAEILAWFNSSGGNSVVLLLLFSIPFLGGCKSMPDWFNLGDGKLFGVVSYELPAGLVLPGGQTIEPGASLVDVVMKLGINLAAAEMVDKWNVNHVMTTNGVSTVFTDYGDFSFATGEMTESIKSISFAQPDPAEPLQIKFEDADGIVKVGIIKEE